MFLSLFFLPFTSALVLSVSLFRLSHVVFAGNAIERLCYVSAEWITLVLLSIRFGFTRKRNFPGVSFFSFFFFFFFSLPLGCLS